MEQKIDYKATIQQATSLKQDIIENKKKENELSNIFNKFLETPPESQLYNRFLAEKWDSDYIINFLCHFLEMKNLTEEVQQLLELFKN